MMDNFNAAPILFHDDRMSKDLFAGNPATETYDDDESEEVINVPQNLSIEMAQYEFPPKSRLQALAHRPSDPYSFFDESSFTTTSTFSGLHYEEDFRPTSAHSKSSVPSLTRPYADDHLDRFFNSTFPDTAGQLESWFDDDDMEEDIVEEEEEELEDELVEDGRLSPLELPEQVTWELKHPLSPIIGSSRAREQSCDSTTTVTQCRVANQHQDDLNAVAPSSFLSVYNSTSSSSNGTKRPMLSSRSTLDSVVEEDVSPSPWLEQGEAHPRAPSSHSSHSLPVFRSESELYANSVSGGSTASDSVVLIKFAKKNIQAPLTVIQRCSSTHTWACSDEGYDDQLDDKEPPIESASVFLPLSNGEQQHLMHSDMLRTAAATKIQAVWRGYQARKALGNPLMGLVRLCGNVHRRQMHTMTRRLHDLEYRLNEETAMRIAFEKAMEDMTLLVDKQQKVLYDRIEQEVSIREAYERKMSETEAQVKPLHQRIVRETQARAELESMMTHVLEQVSDLKAASVKETQAREAMEQQLKDAQAEIAALKRTRTTTPAATTAKATTHLRSTTPSALRSTTPSTLRSTTPSSTRLPPRSHISTAATARTTTPTLRTKASAPSLRRPATSTTTTRPPSSRTVRGK